MFNLIAKFELLELGRKWHTRGTNYEELFLINLANWQNRKSLLAISPIILFLMNLECFHLGFALVLSKYWVDALADENC